MKNRIKEYLAYRKNRKIVRREWMQMAAAALPIMKATAGCGMDLANSFMKLADEAKAANGEKLSRLLAYMADLTPEEIQRILVHSLVETGSVDTETE